MSLEPVLAGFGITGAVEKALRLYICVSIRLSRGGGALENDVCGWAYQEVYAYVEIETYRFLILFS